MHGCRFTLMLNIILNNGERKVNRKKELQIKRHQKRKFRLLRKWFLIDQTWRRDIRLRRSRFRRVNRKKAYKLDDRRRVGIL